MGNSDYHKLKEKFKKEINEISAEILKNIEISFTKQEFNINKGVNDWKNEIMQYIAQNLNSSNQKFKDLLKEMKQSLKFNNQEEKMNIDNNVDYPYNERDKHDQYKDINYKHINRNENRIEDNINKNIIESNNCFMPHDI